MSPEHCEVIEDAVGGMTAAKARGMLCAAVAQTFPSEQLRLVDSVRNRICENTVAELLG
jgi:beta-phosphoglucomutase-like phosphatase (HAD superfamily)